MRILCIDPGSKRGHTGIVMMDDTGKVENTWAVPDGVKGFIQWCVDYQLKPDLIVCEKFIHGGGAGLDVEPLLIEGALQALYGWHCEIVWQHAAGRKSAVPNSVLQRAGLIFKGDHHGDRTEAARHGIWYLKKQGLALELFRLEPPPKKRSPADC